VLGILSLLNRRFRNLPLSKSLSSRLIAMKRLVVLLFTAGVILALASAVDAFAQNDGAGSDLLERRTRQLAGPDAVDCGRVGPRAEPKKATDCAITANQAGKAFRVRYDMQGIDSYVAVAFVRLPDGTVEALSYDSDPMGGGGHAHEVVGVHKCPAPVQLYATPKGHLSCFPPQPATPRDVMSPTYDPY
jgi:hypothetical protein